VVTLLGPTNFSVHHFFFSGCRPAVIVHMYLPALVLLRLQYVVPFSFVKMTKASLSPCDDDDDDVDVDDDDDGDVDDDDDVEVNITGKRSGTLSALQNSTNKKKKTTTKTKVAKNYDDYPAGLDSMDFDNPAEFNSYLLHAKSKDTLHKEQLRAKSAEISVLKGRISFANQQIIVE